MTIDKVQKQAETTQLHNTIAPQAATQPGSSQVKQVEKSIGAKEKRINNTKRKKKKIVAVSLKQMLWIKQKPKQGTDNNIKETTGKKVAEGGSRTRQGKKPSNPILQTRINLLWRYINKTRRQMSISAHVTVLTKTTYHR